MTAFHQHHLCVAPRINTGRFPAILVVIAMVLLCSESWGVALTTIPNPRAQEYASFGASVSVNSEVIAIGSRTAVFTSQLGEGSLWPIATEGGSVAYQVELSGGSLAVGNGEFVDVFDYRTGRQQRRLQNPALSGGEFGSRLAASSLPFDNRLLVSGAAGTVHLFDTFSGTLIRTFANPDSAEAGFGRAFSIYGDSVAISTGTGDGPGRVHVFNARTGGLLHSFDPPKEFSGFGSAVAVSTNRVLVGAPFEFVGHPQNEFALGRVYAFDLSTGGSAYSLSNPAPGEFTRGVKTDDLFGTSLAIDQDLLVVGVDGNTVEDAAHVFDVDTGEYRHAFENPGFPLHYGAVDIAGQTIVVGNTTDSAEARFAGAVYVATVPEPKSFVTWGALCLLSCLALFRQASCRQSLSRHSARLADFRMPNP